MALVKFCYLSLFLLWIGIPLLADCVSTRAAFDIGSGSTKMKVARVDTCKQLLLEVLLEKETVIAFKEDMKANGGSFSDLIAEEAEKKLRALQTEARNIGAKNFVAVATSAFRDAKNAAVIVAKWQKGLGFPVHIIAADKEAELGFWGAVVATGEKASEMVVWDVGGGSMQIATLDKDKKLRSYLGNMAAVGFKDLVLEKIFLSKRKNTPNPLGKENMEKAKQLADQEAAKAATDSWRQLFAGKKVFGIGGVHYYSLRGQVGKKSYSAEQLLQKADERAEWDDTKIGGDYASTDITNLLLVAAFMKAFAFAELEAIRVNLTNTLLVYPQLVAKP